MNDPRPHGSPEQSWGESSVFSNHLRRETVENLFALSLKMALAAVGIFLASSALSLSRAITSKPMMEPSGSRLTTRLSESDSGSFLVEGFAQQDINGIRIWIIVDRPRYFFLQTESPTVLVRYAVITKPSTFRNLTAVQQEIPFDVAVVEMNAWIPLASSYFDRFGGVPSTTPDNPLIEGCLTLTM